MYTKMLSSAALLLTVALKRIGLNEWPFCPGCPLQIRANRRAENSARFDGMCVNTGPMFSFSKPVVLNEIISVCTVAATTNSLCCSCSEKEMVRVLRSQLEMSGIMFHPDGENPVSSWFGRCGIGACSKSVGLNIVFYSKHWPDAATPFKWAGFHEGLPPGCPIGP